MRRYGYHRRKTDNWWVLSLPGFHDINAYVWTGLDSHGRPNGLGTWRLRLAILRSHRGFFR